MMKTGEAKKIKVLQLPVLNQQGGVTSYVLSRFHLINTQRFQFDLLTFGGYLDCQPEVENAGGKVQYIASRAEEDTLSFEAELRAVLEKGAYDVIHLHTSFWKGFRLEELALEYRIPQIIVHSHSTAIDILDPVKRAEALAQHERMKQQFHPGLATHFCACSQAAAEWLFGEQIPPEQITILHNAIDTEKFAFSNECREVYRKKLGLEGKFVLGHVGRFVYPKNHFFLLDVFEEVAKLIPEAVLLLVGVGPLKEELNRMVMEKNLDKKVLFLGARDDVPGLLQAMDVFLLPSHFEGLPIVQVEAQCSGLPVLSSDTITREAMLTPLIEFLPLAVGCWVERLNRLYQKQNLTQGVRSSFHPEIKEKGYDLKTEIKVLEKFYEDGVS